MAAKKGLKRVPRVQSITKRRSAATIWTVSQLLEGFGDPRAILLEIAATPTEQLMKDAGCTYMEALAERRLSALAVLPYVAQKLPVQVDMRHTRAIHLNIVDDRQYAALVEVAADTGQPDDAMQMQVITGHVVEDDTTEAQQEEGESPITLAVPADAPQGADASSDQAQRTLPLDVVKQGR